MDPTRYQRFLGPALAPLGAMYGGLMAVRRGVWESGLLRQFLPDCPCVSVGNIAWGGTGKTPLVDWLMEWSLRRGLKPVVLTRGYKADLSIVPVRVSAHHTARETGDEPLMLGLAHLEADVLVDPNRRRAAEYALRSLHPDLLLLDDGFQHLAMGRHLDLVLLRPADVLDQWNRIIPAGSWREGQAALSRAAAFLIKTPPEGLRELIPALREKLEGFQRPVFSFFLRPRDLLKVGEPDVLTAEAFGRRPYVLVSGVGDPGQVRDTAARFLGGEPEHHFIFPDHHRFLFRDARRISAMGLPALCTAKDAVKLRHIPIPDLWCLRVEVAFGPRLWSEADFPQWWAACWAAMAARCSRPGPVQEVRTTDDCGCGSSGPLESAPAGPEDKGPGPVREPGTGSAVSGLEKNSAPGDVRAAGSQVVSETSDSGDKSAEDVEAHPNVRSETEKTPHETASSATETRSAEPGAGPPRPSGKTPD